MKFDADAMILLVRHAAVRDLARALDELNQQLHHARGLELVVEVVPERDPATGALHLGMDVYDGATCISRQRMHFTAPATRCYPQPMSRRVWSEFQTWCDPVGGAECIPVGVYYDEDPLGKHFLCLNHFSPTTGYVERRSEHTR